MQNVLRKLPNSHSQCSPIKMCGRLNAVDTIQLPPSSTPTNLKLSIRTGAPPRLAEPTSFWCQYMLMNIVEKMLLVSEISWENWVTPLLWTRQPGLGKVRHGLRQVHQTVCDQVRPGQVHEEDVCGPQLRSGLGRERKPSQPFPIIPVKQKNALVITRSSLEPASQRCARLDLAVGNSFSWFAAKFISCDWLTSSSVLSWLPNCSTF